MKRRVFMQRSAVAGLAVAAAPMAASSARTQATPDGTAKKRVRVGLIGCGSVSGVYLSVLNACPFVEVVSVCDIKPERAKRRADEFQVEHHYPHIEAMLSGAPFELLVVTADMQQHEPLNRQALAAGKHVWSEKPIANSLAAAQELLQLARGKQVRLWGAPITVESPQFAFMARTLAAGKLGRVAAAHAHYGHEGPDWSAFFYEQLGGSLPDLGVYNLTTLTGLLGPARAVTATLSIVTPERTVQDKGRIQVAEEDNAMLLLDHGHGVISHVQSGFNYFNPHGHDGSHESRYTIDFVGTSGFMGLVGYDWAPLGVELATQDAPELKRYATDAQGYAWPLGACMAAECLATGKEMLVQPEHSIHVLDIICSARESSRTGRRVELTSTFPWPIV